MKLLPTNIINIIIQSNNNIIIKWLHSDIIKEKITPYKSRWYYFWLFPILFYINISIVLFPLLFKIIIFYEQLKNKNKIFLSIKYKN